MFSFTYFSFLWFWTLCYWKLQISLLAYVTEIQLVKNLIAQNHFIISFGWKSKFILIHLRFFSLLLQRKIIRGCTWKEAWNDDTYLSFKCYLNCVFRARYWIWNLHVRVSMLCPCGMTNAALWSMYGIHMAESGSKHSSLRCHTVWELNNDNTKLKLCKLKEKFL